MERVLLNDELYHHGILGQKWGVRRYQNADGSYTSVGKKRRSEDKEINQKVQRGQKVSKPLLVAYGAVTLAALHSVLMIDYRYH